MAATKRKSKIINLIIILFVVLLIMIGVYYYFFHTLKATGEEISTISNDTSSKTAQESNLESIQGLFRATGSEQNELDSRFIQSDEAIDFITTVENLAAFAHLTHETESVDTEPADPASDTYELLHLTFKTDGSWQNTFYFIALLETLPYNISINQINLHTTGDTTTAVTSVSPIDLGLGNSTSTSASTVSKKSSEWEGTYDFTVIKLK